MIAVKPTLLTKMILENYCLIKKFKKMTNEELKGMLDEFKSTLPKGMSVEDVNKAIDGKLSEISKELETITELKQIVDGIKSGIVSLESKIQENNSKMETKTIRDLLVDSKALDELKAKRTIEFEVKAVGDVTVPNVVVADTAARMSVLGINGTPYAVNRWFGRNIMDVVDMGTSDKATIVYVDEVNGEGAVGTTAEGVAKNQIDIDYKEVTVNAVKYTGLVKVTEEALDDVSFMEGEINRVLNEKLAIAKSAAILTDILAAATTYSLTDYNNKVVAADTVDAIVAATAQSVLSGYSPNAIVMHPIDIAGLQLIKSANIPRVTTDANGTMVNGLRVVANTQITKDNFVLGDLSKFRVRIYKDKLVMGHDADDFSKNKRTIIAETRLLKYISTNEKTSLIKGVFATIKAALLVP